MSEELNNECKIRKGLFAIEITTTQGCNFNCSYCFERDFKPNDTIINSKDIITKIDEMLEDEWFSSKYDGIKIIFWGGEPTLNFKMCSDLMEEYLNNERICFFIYTNGSTIDQLLPYLIVMKDKKYANGESKFVVQVSYDGNPINDKCRIPKTGEKCSEIVLDTVEKLSKNKIDFGLKSTLSFENFKYLPEIWEDFNNLYDKFGEKITYALTVDYYDVKFKEFRETVENTLIDISIKELNFFREHNRFLSNMFKLNRAICGTGMSMATVDTDGSVYYCHGCIYSDNSDSFSYTNIRSDDFIRDLQKETEKMRKISFEPEKCKNCISTMCLRCNVRKYDMSKKKEFAERWFDYTSQPDLCEYYQMVGKIGAALRNLIQKEEKSNAMHM
jgi:radical SAM protein with 4Fe4S-binding SPASM domain